MFFLQNSPSSILCLYSLDFYLGFAPTFSDKNDIFVDFRANVVYFPKFYSLKTNSDSRFNFLCEFCCDIPKNASTITKINKFISILSNWN